LISRGANPLNSGELKPVIGATADRAIRTP
jgi:hypothetical protein